MAATTTDPPVREESISVRKSRTVGDFLADFAAKYSLIALLVLAFAVCSIALPEKFLTVGNLQSIAASQAIVAFLGLGLMFPLIVGEFDLSVGYMLGLSQALVIGLMTFTGVPMVWAIVIVLLVCAGIGAISGLIVARSSIHSLIVTLAVGSVLSGITYWYTKGNVLHEGVPGAFASIARTDAMGVPLPFLYLLVTCAIAALFLTRSVRGRRFYAVGANREAARLVGVRVHTLVVCAFALSGLLAGVAGVLIASRLSSAQAGLGPSFLLPAFAAAFLGATVIRPGRFNAFGVVIAVYLLAIASSGLLLSGVAGWAEEVFNGAALLAAVGVSHRIASLRRKRAEAAVSAARAEGEVAERGTAPS